MSTAARRLATRRDRLQRYLYPAFVAAALLAAWQGMVAGLDLPPYVVPSPVLVARTLLADWTVLWGALQVTLTITLLAFALATVTGVLVSFLFAQSRAIETALFPYACLLYTSDAADE